jgi:hypothetical protein
MLTNLTTCGFIDAVGERSPAPGGGSVAALIGSLVSSTLLAPRIYYYNVIRLKSGSSICILHSFYKLNLF